MSVFSKSTGGRKVKWGKVGGIFLNLKNLKATQQPMNLLGGKADPQQPATSWEPDPQQPETPHIEQTNVCFPHHWAVALTASCFPHTQASHNLWYPKTGPDFTAWGKADECRPPAFSTALGRGKIYLKKKMTAFCGCCYSCGDGDANQFPAERKICCFSVGTQGGLERWLGKGMRRRKDERKKNPGQAFTWQVSLHVTFHTLLSALLRGSSLPLPLPYLKTENKPGKQDGGQVMRTLLKNANSLQLLDQQNTHTRSLHSHAALLYSSPPTDTISGVHGPKGLGGIIKTDCHLHVQVMHVRYSNALRRLQMGIFTLPLLLICMEQNHGVGRNISMSLNGLKCQNHQF